ncbi:MAG: hypothetical protein K2J80_13635 [Oscillospiraceae bacterium]|nr:hypothetical protein [Oscillospiraceae bacterium]
MIKLLRANLARMFKTKLFWICAAAALVLSFFNSVFKNMILASSSNGLSGEESGFYGTIILTIFITAVFSALFLGTDYSDNTIRNKLVVGFARTQIYFANLFAVTTGALGFAVSGTLGMLLKQATKKARVDLSEIAVGIIACVFAIFADCSFFTLMSMMITKKSSVVVWSLFITIGVYFGSAYISQRLNEKELNYGSYYDETIGDYTETGYYPNSRYVSGTKRAVMTTANNLTSFGSVFQAGSLEPDDALLLPLYSLTASAAVSAAGVLMFRKKDIK